MAATYGDSPIHPILDRAHEFEIVRFDLNRDVDDPRNDFLDLTLRREKDVRRLRFIRPRSIKIEEGFPAPTGGMVILDIRHRQWEDVTVKVADFEASNGAVTFYAADVIDLDKAQ